MLTVSKNNEKFYLKGLTIMWCNYSSLRLQQSIYAKYEAMQGAFFKGCFVRGKGGLSQRLDVRLI